MGLTPGSRLGRYQIIRQLGAGAMGEVYLAEDPQIERRLAIKTVRLENVETTSEEMHRQLRLRLEREAKAAGRLVHPHVVTLFDAGEIDGLFFLAFEYVDGPDLGARSRRGPPLELHEIVRIAREAASALDAAHRVGIVHRDIKPANMLLTAGGSLKIADFGIATLVGQATHLTQAGALIGTPQYLSPEQVRTELPLDGRSDLFSVGVVLYELLAGKRPFDGGSMAALLYAVVTNDPQPIQELRPDLPPRLSAAVMRLLAKQPDDRFPSAAALGAELAAIERELPIAPQHAAVLPPTLHKDPSLLPTMNAAAPIAPTLQSAAPIAPTLQSGAPIAPIAPTLQVDAPPPARARRAGALAVILPLLLLLGGGAGVYYWVKSPRQPDAPVEQRVTKANPPVTASSAPAVETTTSSPVTDLQPLSSSAVSSAPPDGGNVRVVGGLVSFRVTPRDAAERAVVKVDGLVRGMALDSVHTLRPGRHDIEIVAEGYVTEKLTVEARDDGSASETVDVAMRTK